MPKGYCHLEVNDFYPFSNDLSAEHLTFQTGFFGEWLCSYMERSPKWLHYIIITFSSHLTLFSQENNLFSLIFLCSFNVFIRQLSFIFESWASLEFFTIHKMCRIKEIMYPCSFFRVAGTNDYCDFLILHPFC